MLGLRFFLLPGIIDDLPLNKDIRRLSQLDLKDKSLICFDCGAPYVFTVEEQQAFHAKGHNHPPKRCPSCRAARAARKPERSIEKDKYTNTFTPPATRQLYTVICSECGKETQVPFEPRTGRPVYCSDCYHKNRTEK